MIIDKNIFVGELNIPGTDGAATAARLDYFIQKYETEFLRRVMGYDFATEFVAALAGTPEQVWLDLRDGSGEWAGLKTAIACYVYFHWMRDVETTTTKAGEVRSTVENAEPVTGGYKMIRAWNEMIDIVWGMWKFLDDSDSYPTWVADWSYRYTFRYINSFGI